MVIKKLDLDDVEEILNGVSEFSIELKVLQDQIKIIDDNVKSNKKFLSDGTISQSLHDDINNNLDKQKKQLTARLKAPANKLLGLCEELTKLMMDCKV